MVFQALGPYAQGFSASESSFLYFYADPAGEGPHPIEKYNRGEFWDLATRAAHFLGQQGLGWGDAQIHGFGRNHPLDLIWRLAAAFVGTVPVTVNWQADDPATVLYKIRLTGGKLFIKDTAFDAVFSKEIASSLPALSIVQADQPLRETSGGVNPFGAGSHIEKSDAKIIVFTSGTTGKPKGVRLSYLAYETNAASFEQFLTLQPEEKVALVVVNPLHHANATAITDWGMRRGNAEIHLFEKYSRHFWPQLLKIASGDVDRVVVPLVSRHFDFLANLLLEQPDFLDCDLLRRLGRKIEFLLGSAPVGPTTVRRILSLAGVLPRVRFGSTETCLQVMGTPSRDHADLVFQAFRRGWDAQSSPMEGYYLGRPHPPFTQVQIVRATEAGVAGFMESCLEGECGYLVTRGANLMMDYVGQARESQNVMVDGWYTGLRDKGYWLQNPYDGNRDYYWVGRDSNLLIRGGANYANTALAEELGRFVCEAFHLEREAFEIAVVGVRLNSEHEDSCCVVLELQSPQARALASQFEREFMQRAAARVSKAARPDRLLLAPIPRNFKGAVQTPALKELFQAGKGISPSGT